MVLEIQKPRVKVGDQPEATSCPVVTPGLCPSCALSMLGCSEEPSWSLQSPLSGEAGGGKEDWSPLRLRMARPLDWGGLAHP